MSAPRRLKEIRAALRERNAWQVYDITRRWYCPFCAQATLVVVEGGGRLDADTLATLVGHLHGCRAYAYGRGEEKPVAYLESIVAYANRTHKMAEHIRAKVKSDPSWRLRDAERHWVCPYCREVCAHIDFSTAVQMVQTGPVDIARHLISNCSRFRQVRSDGALAVTDSNEQSSASLEIVRLGAAPAPELVQLSGLPPGDVSGSYGLIGAGGTSAGVTAGEQTEPESWQSEVHQRLVEVRRGLLAGRGPAASSVELPEFKQMDTAVFQRCCGPEPEDIVDAIELADGSVMLVLGAVTGADSDAELVPTIVRNLIRLYVRRTQSPKEVVLRINEDIHAEAQASTFVVLVMACLAPDRRSVRFVRAGGVGPWLLRGDRRSPAEQFEPEGMAIGVDNGGVFGSVVQECSLALASGDLFVLASPGAIGADDVERRPFGAEQLARSIERYGRHEADYFVVKLGHGFEGWTRGAPLRADASVLVAKVQ